MKNLLFLILMFVLIGIICFGIAGHSYWTLQKLFEELAYYGAIEQVYSSDNEITKIIFNLKFGIAKFIVFGIVSWLFGLILYIFGRKSTVKK